MAELPILGLKVKMLRGTNIKGKHYGINHVKVQKLDPKTKQPLTKEVNGKTYPIFEQMCDPETGDYMFDANKNPIYVTKAVADIADVDNEDFKLLISSTRAVTACDYDLVVDKRQSKLEIVRKEDKKKFNE